MDPTIARQVLRVVLLALFLTGSSSVHVFYERIRVSPYGLPMCFTNCGSGLVECGFQCLVQAPLQCLVDCIATQGPIPDPFLCAQQCTSTILDCLEECSSSPAPGPLPPAPQPPAARPPIPPFLSPVQPPALARGLSEGFWPLLNFPAEYTASSDRHGLPPSFPLLSSAQPSEGLSSAVGSPGGFRPSAWPLHIAAATYCRPLLRGLLSFCRAAASCPCPHCEVHATATYGPASASAVASCCPCPAAHAATASYRPSAPHSNQRPFPNENSNCKYLRIN
ncbi:hypothetical protein CRG98_046276 [Punica granatum]|uniref:Uncharacterized protein n=1 Tax=Punica granatum TaxID=22663 RepID=A0A2I0HP47_PUNGR|nr:hypothetical protein CRG98_046276 [Punica granatum]